MQDAVSRRFILTKEAVGPPSAPELHYWRAMERGPRPQDPCKSMSTIFPQDVPPQDALALEATFAVGWQRPHHRLP